MTDDELEAVEREHYRSEGASILYDYPLCNCTAAWPCDATRLLAEVRRLRAALRVLAARQAEISTERDALRVQLAGAENCYHWRRAQCVPNDCD